jgi:hypothetical protein
MRTFCEPLTASGARILSFPSYSFAYPFSLRAGTTTYEVDKSADFSIALDSDTVAETANIEEALNSLNLDNTSQVCQKRLEDANEIRTIGEEDEVFQRLHAALGEVILSQ